jgi:hypothetical protein
LKGKVVDADGNPVAGATVTALAGSSGFNAADTAVTDANGEFTLRVPDGGDYRVDVESGALTSRSGVISVPQPQPGESVELAGLSLQIGPDKVVVTTPGPVTTTPGPTVTTPGPTVEVPVQVPGDTVVKSVPGKTVTVKPVVTKVKIGQAAVTLVKGKTFTVPVGMYFSANTSPTYRGIDLTWKSSNPKVVKVREDGKLTALKAGTATITAKAKKKDADGKLQQATIKVTVVKKAPKAKVTKVSATKVPKTMKVGQVVYITGTYAAKNAAGVKVKYSTAKYSIVSVDKAGRLVAGQKGTDTLTIKAGKKTVKYKITVK